MGALAKALAEFCIAFLNNYLSRVDLQDKTRLEVADAVNKLALVAAQWKAAAAASPDGGGDLRVQPGAGTVPLPGDYPDSPGGSGGV